MKEEHGGLFSESLCVLVSEHPEFAEQQLRRTAQVGLANLDNLDIEHYMYEDFVDIPIACTVLSR